MPIRKAMLKQTHTKVTPVTIEKPTARTRNANETRDSDDDEKSPNREKDENIYTHMQEKKKYVRQRMWLMYCCKHENENPTGATARHGEIDTAEEYKRFPYAPSPKIIYKNIHIR